MVSRPSSLSSILLVVGTLFRTSKCLSDVVMNYPGQLHKFREELRNRSRVLKRLGHINADGVVQPKGRAACLIDTADELLVTELMFNGTIFCLIDLGQCLQVWWRRMLVCYIELIWQCY